MIMSNGPAIHAYCEANVSKFKEEETAVTFIFNL